MTTQSYNDFVNFFKSNLPAIRKARALVEEKIVNHNFYDHYEINTKPTDEETVEIVMTSSDRSVQVYFTLETFKVSNYKNIHVVLVDDSTSDHLDTNMLASYDIHIDLIIIKSKCWLNPLVNYNIGFQYLKNGGKVIIQNGEVCHLGDVIQYVHLNHKKGDYLAFDVRNLPDFDEVLWLTSQKDRIGYHLFEEYLERQRRYNKHTHDWYQHYENRNAYFHFLIAVDREDFNKIKGFDYDFTASPCYDDDQLVYHALEVLKLNPVNVKNDEVKIIGVHQWHVHKFYWNNEIASRIPRNQQLFEFKKNYHKRTGIWYDFSKDNSFDLFVRYLKSNINKIVVFGSTGMLGSYITKYFNDRLKVVTVNRDQYNPLIDKDEKLEKILNEINVNSDTTVINCIGLIPQRVLEPDIKTYTLINSIFPIKLSYLCQRLGSRMIHFTTDCVYDGQKGNYSEDDQPTETSLYGITKAIGEPENCTVIRSSIIGEEIRNKKSFVEFVKSNKDGEVNGYTNHIWNGVTCLQMCKIIEHIILDNLFWNGVRHILSPEPTSKADMIETVNRVYNLNIKINRVETDKRSDKTLTSKYQNYRLFNIPSINQQIEEMYRFKLI